MANTTTTEVFDRLDTVIVKNAANTTLATIGVKKGKTQVLDVAVATFTYDGTTLTVTVPTGA